jgi:hypothetical protein
MDSRYKAWLVIKRYEQKEGIETNVQDVTAFLNPNIKRHNIQMAAPPGIDWLEPNKSTGNMLLLQKALYGRKPAPRLWYGDIGGFLQYIGFRDQGSSSGCNRGELQFTGHETSETPLDPRRDQVNTCCEDKTANRKEYLSMVGSLMYTALGSQPDITFSVTALSRYNVQPRDARDGYKESASISKDYFGISNSLSAASLLTSSQRVLTKKSTPCVITSGKLTSSQYTHHHYQIYRLGLAREPYNSEIGQRMCVRSRIHQC